MLLIGTDAVDLFNVFRSEYLEVVDAEAGESEREIVSTLAWVCLSCFSQILHSDQSITLLWSSDLFLFFSLIDNWWFISFEFKMTYPRNHTSKSKQLKIII